MNERYYSDLDKIILRSKRKKMLRKYKQNAASAIKFLFAAVAFWGIVYIVCVSLFLAFPSVP